jgi:hypothetical protein
MLPSNTPGAFDDNTAGAIYPVLARTSSTKRTGSPDVSKGASMYSNYMRPV